MFMQCTAECILARPRERGAIDWQLASLTFQV